MIMITKYHDVHGRPITITISIMSAVAIDATPLQLDWVLSVH